MVNYCLGSGPLIVHHSNGKYSCTGGFQWCLGVKADMGLAFYGGDCSQRGVRSRTISGSPRLIYVYRDFDTVGLMARDIAILHRVYEVTGPEKSLKEVRFCAILLIPSHPWMYRNGAKLNHSEPSESDIVSNRLVSNMQQKTSRNVGYIYDPSRAMSRHHSH